MYWANVAVVFKITILLLVTYLVSLNCPVTLGIIDQTLSNFQAFINIAADVAWKITWETIKNWRLNWLPN